MWIVFYRCNFGWIPGNYELQVQLQNGIFEHKVLSKFLRIGIQSKVYITCNEVENSGETIFASDNYFVLNHIPPLHWGVIHFLPKQKCIVCFDGFDGE